MHSPQRASVEDGPRHQMLPSALLEQLRCQIKELLDMPAAKILAFGRNSTLIYDVEDSSLNPKFWITGWADDSSKYGFAYRLSNDSVGVLFTDKTRLILLPNGHDLHYIARDMTEEHFTTENFPKSSEQKVKLIKWFKEYMQKNLVVSTGAKYPTSDGDAPARYPFVVDWFRFNQCLIMMLNNGSIQMNFLESHVKILLCPLKQAVTYLHCGEGLRTFSFSKIAKVGCSMDLLGHLKDAYDLIPKLTAHLIENRTNLVFRPRNGGDVRPPAVVLPLLRAGIMWKPSGKPPQAGQLKIQQQENRGTPGMVKW